LVLDLGTKTKGYSQLEVMELVIETFQIWKLKKIETKNILSIMKSKLKLGPIFKNVKSNL
jgi:hypothetical protein